MNFVIYAVTCTALYSIHYFQRCMFCLNTHHARIHVNYLESSIQNDDLNLNNTVEQGVQYIVFVLWILMTLALREL